MAFGSRRSTNQAVGAPAACKMQIERPNDGYRQRQKLTEEIFRAATTRNYGAMFANKIT